MSIELYYPISMNFDLNFTFRGFVLLQIRATNHRYRDHFGILESSVKQALSPKNERHEFGFGGSGRLTKRMKETVLRVVQRKSDIGWWVKRIEREKGVGGIKPVY